MRRTKVTYHSRNCVFYTASLVFIWSNKNCGFVYLGIIHSYLSSLFYGINFVRKTPLRNDRGQVDRPLIQTKDL